MVELVGLRHRDSSGVCNLKLIEWTAFNRHFRLKIPPLRTVHLGALLRDKLFRCQVRWFNVQFDGGCFVDRFQRVSGGGAVIDAGRLRPCHQRLLQTSVVCISELPTIDPAKALLPRRESREFFKHLNAFLRLATARNSKLQSLTDSAGVDRGVLY